MKVIIDPIFVYNPVYNCGHMASAIEVKELGVVTTNATITITTPWVSVKVFNAFRAIIFCNNQTTTTLRWSVDSTASDITEVTIHPTGVGVNICMPVKAGFLQVVYTQLAGSTLRAQWFFDKRAIQIGAGPNGSVGTFIQAFNVDGQNWGLNPRARITFPANIIAKNGLDIIEVHAFGELQNVVPAVGISMAIRQPPGDGLPVGDQVYRFDFADNSNVPKLIDAVSVFRWNTSTSIFECYSFINIDNPIENKLDFKSGFNTQGGGPLDLTLPWELVLCRHGVGPIIPAFFYRAEVKTG